MKEFSFSIDRGGTFTDIYCEITDTDTSTTYYDIHKLLSVDPKNYPDASREGIRRLLEKHLNTSFDPNKPIDTSNIRSIRIGTTVATNALLEHKGEPTCLVITKGFRDLMEIGNQARPNIFDLEIKKGLNIYAHVLEVDERVILAKSENASKEVDVFADAKSVTSVSGEKLLAIKEPDLDQIRKNLKEIYDKGIKAIAVIFMHSYIYSKHEELVGNIAKELGFTQISLSSQIFPRAKIVPRGQTALVDAYLNPKITDYIESFTKGFDENIHKKVNLFFMQSDGGLASATSFTGVRAILSGPAGGIVGYSFATLNHKFNTTKKPALGFDMGGTSTDVSKYDGTFEHIFETNVAGVNISAPQLDINTVAAGGGSRLFFKNGLFKVGPESAGADPGPVCYRKNGHLAITDANLLLGRILPKYFPKIFGPNHDQPLDFEATQKAFEEIGNQINSFYKEEQGRSKDIYEVAYGFIKVANEVMCRPMRALTQARGLDPKNYVLSVFGGAGAQHACQIARSLGIRSIFIHRLCGILSAFGINIADVAVEAEKPSGIYYTGEKSEDKSGHTIEGIFEELQKSNVEKLKVQGFKDKQMLHETYLNLRYEGTDTALMVSTPQDHDYKKSFEDIHRREYGFVYQSRKILIDNIRVRSLGRQTEDQSTHTVPSYDSIKNKQASSNNSPLEPIEHVEAYFEINEKLEKTKTPVYDLVHLIQRQGEKNKVNGPCIILNDTSTILVEPGFYAFSDEQGSLWLEATEGHDEKKKKEMKAEEIKVDPIELSIFAHRFMSIAEQMGKVLQRTSISTNIKERLDFSCAIFGPDGALVANAPHLPVHLGSMGEAVKYQINTLGDNWKEGEVILANHPMAGGTHLPDITLMTPVFSHGKPVFYVASRGHHADIGGLTPGSLPPFSRSLDEEGVSCLGLKAVRNGEFQEEDVIKLMTRADEPGKQGTRALRDNLSDFKAQIAANNKGIDLVKGLIEEYGLVYVQAYMKFIQQNAADSVREMLVTLSEREELKEIDTVYAEDFMDDGNPIKLALTIDRKQRTAVFDFTGTGPQQIGNTNAPKAITYSAIIYCLRCLVQSEIPLNQGCLEPIKIILPDGNSMLNPSADAAVVGGNVLTSQRITDVVLKAFRACAASQGDMNNLTFGTDKWGYYETIGGGSGAGPYWEGKSGVQTHMTNTRITDPEVLERRYPVILRVFQIREGSGGKGKYKGGDGIIREIEFLEDVHVAILSERRAFAPFGLNGGFDGARGMTIYVRKDGIEVNFGAKNGKDFETGSRIRVLTPGGGGYGNPGEKRKDDLGKEEGDVGYRHGFVATGTIGAAKYTQETN